MFEHRLLTACNRPVEPDNTESRSSNEATLRWISPVLFVASSHKKFKSASHMRLHIINREVYSCHRLLLLMCTSAQEAVHSRLISHFRDRNDPIKGVTEVKSLLEFSQRCLYQERKEEIILKLVIIPKDPVCSLLWEPASWSLWIVYGVKATGLFACLHILPDIGILLDH